MGRTVVKDAKMKNAKLMGVAATVLGILLFLQEILSFSLYILDASNPIRHFYVVQNHLNLAVFLLSFWLLLFGVFLKEQNIRASNIAALFFVFFWPSYLIYSLLFQNGGFYLGFIYFYFPHEVFERIMFFAATTISLLIIEDDSYIED